MLGFYPIAYVLKRKLTPCMGICSTTYGDLVCRGCKRFAHEVVEWNGYDAGQREVIWQRLEGVRDQVIGQALMIVDIGTYLGFCRAHHLSTALEADGLFTVVAMLVKENLRLKDAGLAYKPSEAGADAEPNADALDVMKLIDGFEYDRALAHYERNFRVPQG